MKSGLWGQTVDRWVLSRASISIACTPGKVWLEHTANSMQRLFRDLLTLEYLCTSIPRATAVGVIGSSTSPQPIRNSLGCPVASALTTWQHRNSGFVCETLLYHRSDQRETWQVAVLTARVLVVNWSEPVPLAEVAALDIDALPDSPNVQRHLSAAVAAREGILRLDSESLARPEAFSDLLRGWHAVEYWVGPVIRATYDDTRLLESKAFGLMNPHLPFALGDCLRAFFRPSAAVENLLLPRFSRRPAPCIGVHVRVTMSHNASEGGDSQIGPASSIPLRRQGQVYILNCVAAATMAL